MNLYLIRHGHREDAVENPTGRRWPKGRELDPDISSIGVKQAQQTGAILKDADIKAIYASPFLRTVHTAHEIAEILNLEVRLEWGLSEAFSPGYFSDWPGTICVPQLVKMFPRINPTHPQTGILPNNCPEHDYWESFNRYVETTKKLLEKHPDDNILLVSHGAAVGSIPPSFAGWYNFHARPYLCGLTKMHKDADGKWTIELNGDVSHLEFQKI